MFTHKGQLDFEVVAADVGNEADFIATGRYQHSAQRKWRIGSPVDRLLRGTLLQVMAA